MEHIKIVTFKEGTFAFRAMPHILILLDNSLHSFHAINIKWACKEVKIFHVHCCSSSTNDNSWIFLGAGQLKNFSDYFLFEGHARGAYVFLTK